MKITVDYEDLLKVLLLMESNNHLSSSAAGLKERSKNRNDAITILMEMLGIDEERLDRYREDIT